MRYIADSGLACHLLGIETEAELGKSPFLGVLFEGFVLAYGRRRNWRFSSSHRAGWRSRPSSSGESGA